MIEIQHTVVFRLNNGADDRPTSSLRHAGSRRFGGVKDFEVLRQVGQKNDFTHGLSMWFDDQSAYDSYNNHPDHLAFVNDVWLPNVADFLELDYVRTPL